MSRKTDLASAQVPADAVTVLPRSGARLAIYLINMDGATARLTRMRVALDGLGLGFQRVPGIDGRALAYPIPEFSEWSYRLLHGRKRTPPEVGCYLSHVESARQFLASDADLALVLEDDASFQPDLIDSLDRAAMQRDHWNILRLTTVNSGKTFPISDLGNGRALAIALTREKGAGAYVIDRRAASWITTRLIPMRLAWDIAFDLEFMDGLRAAFISPLVASQRSEHQTQIQAGLAAYKLPRWRYFTVLPYRFWLELNRLFRRGGRLLKARMSGAGLRPVPTARAAGKTPDKA